MLMYLLMPSCKLTWVLLVQIQQGKQINKMVQLHDLVQTSTLGRTSLQTNAIHMMTGLPKITIMVIFEVDPSETKPLCPQLGTYLCSLPAVTPG